VRLRELVALAAPLPVTFHRAIDVCADPQDAIATLVACGAARVLTSGQAATAAAGADAIRALVAAAGDRLVVMAGAGVRDDNVAALVARTGVAEVHLSATAWMPSGMRCRRDGVPMGASRLPGEYERRVTDAAVVARVVAALRRG
jgi:copper homeostasis protein